LLKRKSKKFRNAIHDPVTDHWKKYHPPGTIIHQASTWPGEDTGAIGYIAKEANGK